MKQIHNKWITGQAVYYNLINLNQVCFEVTDACNLACHYCVYRDLYIDHDERSGAKMSYEMAKNVIDYLCRIWEKHPSEKIDNQSLNKENTIFLCLIITNLNKKN